MWDFLALLIALIGSGIGAYTDFKTGYIYNRLTYSMAALGLLLRSLESLVELNPEPILWSLIGAGVAFSLSYLIYFTGGWGGGDVKLMTAIGILIPRPIGISPWATYTGIDEVAFPLTIFVNSVIGTFPFLISYLIYKAIRQRRIFREIYSEWRPVKALAFSFWIYFLSEIFSKWWATLLGVLALAYLLRRRAEFTTIAFLLGISALVYTRNASGLITTSLFLLTIALVFSSLRVINRRILREEVRIEELEPGMISSEIVYEAEGKIRKEKATLRNLIKHKENCLVFPSAEGLTKEEIELLADLRKRGEIDWNTLEIKKGIPFGPGILIGLLISITLGNSMVLLGEALQFLSSLV